MTGQINPITTPPTPPTPPPVILPIRMQHSPPTVAIHDEGDVTGHVETLIGLSCPPLALPALCCSLPVARSSAVAVGEELFRYRHPASKHSSVPGR